jgi:hypothetical protein
MPVGGQTTCPDFDSFTANIAVGTPVTFHTTVSDCSGILANTFVLGFNGLTPSTGRVEGRVPECKRSSTSGVGPIVPLNFDVGGKVVLPEFVFARTQNSDPFGFDLAPGTYSIKSVHALTRQVTVRVGRTTQVGLFGTCVTSPSIPTTFEPGAPRLTTTTTLAG